MRKTFVIAKKELSGYFKSPIAYIVLIVTITILNVLFFVIVDQNREANLRDMFKLMEFIFVFIIPIITMKIFAEEKRAGTLEFLMTSPISNGAIVLGKFLGTLAFFSILLLITCTYYIILEFFGQPERGAIIAGYIGIFLEGAFFLSVGLLCSSWSRNQITAAITTYLILFALYFSISFIKYADGTLHFVIQYLGTWSHMQNFSAGLINLYDLVYFLSGAIFCLILTRLSIENRS